MNNKFISVPLFILVIIILLVSIFNISDVVGMEEVTIIETLDATGDLLNFDATYEATLGVGTVRSIEFTEDDGFLAIGISTANKLRIYKRDPIIGCYDLLAPQPSTSGVGNVYGVEFSDSSNILAIGHDVSPYIKIYDVLGDTFTPYEDVDLILDNNVYDLKFYGNDTYLIVGGDFTNYLQVFKLINGDYTKLTGNIDILPTGRVWDISYSKGYIFVATEASPYIMVYKQDGDNLVKLNNPTNLPSSLAYSIDVNDRGNIIALGHSTSPYVKLYEFENEMFTDITLDTIPTQTSITWAVKFVDNSFLYIGGDLAVYKYELNNVGDEFINQTNDLVEFTAPVYVMDHTHDIKRIATGDVSGYDCYTATSEIVFSNIVLQYEPYSINYLTQRGEDKNYTLIDNILIIEDELYDIDIIVSYNIFGDKDNPILNLIPLLSIIVVIVGIGIYIKRK